MVSYKIDNRRAYLWTSVKLKQLFFFRLKKEFQARKKQLCSRILNIISIFSRLFHLLKHAKIIKIFLQKYDGGLWRPVYIKKAHYGKTHQSFVVHSINPYQCPWPQIGKHQCKKFKFWLVEERAILFNLFITLRRQKS